MDIGIFIGISQHILDMGNTNIRGIIPLLTIIWIIVLVVIWFVLKYIVFGKNLYAINRKHNTIWKMGMD